MRILYRVIWVAATCANAAYCLRMMLGFATPADLIAIWLSVLLGGSFHLPYLLILILSTGMWVIVGVIGELMLFGPDPKWQAEADAVHMKIAIDYAERYFGEGDYRTMTREEQDFEQAWLEGNN